MGENMKVRNEDDRIVGFLKLFNNSRVDLSFDKSSRVVLMWFKDSFSRMSFKEFKDFVEALKKYIKYIENSEREESGV